MSSSSIYDPYGIAPAVSTISSEEFQNAIASIHRALRVHGSELSNLKSQMAAMTDRFAGGKSLAFKDETEDEVKMSILTILNRCAAEIQKCINDNPAIKKMQVICKKATIDDEELAFLINASSVIMKKKKDPSEDGDISIETPRRARTTRDQFLDVKNIVVDSAAYFDKRKPVSESGPYYSSILTFIAEWLLDFVFPSMRNRMSGEEAEKFDGFINTDSEYKLCLCLKLTSLKVNLYDRYYFHHQGSSRAKRTLKTMVSNKQRKTAK